MTHLLPSSPSPDKVNQLKRFAHGQALHDWSNRFQPQLLNTADVALQTLQEQLSTIQSDIQALDPFITENYSSEQTRLNLALASVIGSIEKLGAFHARLTAVSAAALLHAMTRGSITEHTERDASPRRRLSSAAGQVVDIVTD
jgi:TolA-binding protein